MLAEEEIKKLKKRQQKSDLSEESFMTDNPKTLYFTGIRSCNVLSALHNVIAPALFIRGNTVLTTFEQLLLTLMKLRLNLPFKYLGFRFSVGKNTAARYFYKCLDVLYGSLKHLIHWPDRETLHESMPACFKEAFGNKVFVEKPSNLYSSSLCWSQYKLHKTVKILIRIAPKRTVSFISKAWGGCVSNKYLTENSGLLNHILPGDVIIEDRGFLIEDTVHMVGAQLNIPAFSKGKSQLRPKDLEDTRTIAQVRIHVERVIGAIRQKYSILS